MKQIVPPTSFLQTFMQCTYDNIRMLAKRSISFKFLFAGLLMMAFSFGSNAQQIQVFDFNSASATAAPIGYNQAGVGTYYSKTSGGTITFGTQSCDGFSKSAATGSSLFIFAPVKDLKSIRIRAYSGSNNRVLNALATAPTLNGTYTNVTYTTSSTLISGACGEILVTPTTPIAGGTYIRFTLSGNIDVVSLVLNVIPTGTPPTIATTSITPGKNFADINGDVTPGTMPLDYSGVIWSTSNTPMDISVVTRTVNSPSATGPFLNKATALTPATNYFGRAYVVDITGKVYYGAIIPFTTLAATVPSLTTVALTNISSFQANSGGSNIDSGGLKITQKGIVWGIATAPTTALATKTTQGPNGTDFASLARILQPNTTYYLRAYAVNSLGTGYGNEVSFTTSGAVPSIVANPNALSFGSVPVNSTPPVFSFLLNASSLAPATGTLTITAPAGYTVSAAANSGFAASLTVNYIGGTVTNKPIFVKLNTSSYGAYCGNILLAGGGATAPNVDTVKVCGNITADPSITTNLGTDFWTGFGYQERQDRSAGDANEAKMSIYISVPAGSQPATVNVEVPGLPGAPGFPKTGLTVAPGAVIEVKDFPTGDGGVNASKKPDTRLFYTGVSSRGVRVVSTNGVPIAVWMHTYAANNSAAGAMLFPTNTWNNSYTVQAYGGQPGASAYQGGFTNNSNPNSFFFVIAEQDNTPIWFTPSQDVIDSSSATIFKEGHTAANVKYAKGIEHGPIFLNKGQVFNAMGFIEGSDASANGLDLSGSKVRTTCDKKIAVFGGNGRCLVNASVCNASSGSDHMIQQMFPSVAWGTKYITVPTKTMEFNMYRITVSDPATKVWINNPTHTAPLTGLINNQYYQLHSRVSLLVESDKPVNVTQFIVAGQCNTSQGGKGDGDPEMIILSPVQQAINNATVYSATIKKSDGGVNGHYINVVIRKGGIPSFRLDGAAVADTGINQVTANATTLYNTGGIIPIANAFVRNPYDTNYYVAKFRVAAGAAHRLYSDSTFNAIAYGMGSGESYGYNAGTNIKDLTKPLLIENPYAPNATNTSCTNNPIRLRAVLPYPPAQVSKIEWFMSQVSGLNRNDTTINTPVADSSYTIDGNTYYVYSNPNFYVFPSAGTYRITGLVTGTFASACGSTSPLDFTLTVIGANDLLPNFGFAYNGCISDTVKFSDSTIAPLYPVTRWMWEFGDSKTDTVQNPAHVYSPLGVYTIKMRVINSIGCYADTVKVIDQTMTLTAKYGVRDTICAGSVVTFTDSSTATAPIVKWMWNYGDGAKDTATTNAPRTHTYNTPGRYIVTLTIENAAGCKNTYIDSIDVRPVPFANFSMPAGICLPGGVTQFTNLSTLTPTGALTYSWTFGDAGTSIVKDPVHTYTSTGPFTIVLTATSQFGCTKDTSRILSTVYAQPRAGFTSVTESCLRDTINFTDTSNGMGNAIVKWYWNFGDNKIDSVKNPKHVYATAGTYTVMLVVTTDKGCTSDTFKTTIKVNPLPTADFTFSNTRCAAQPITFTGQTGTGTITNWHWNLGNGTIKDLPDTSPFTENYSNAGSYNVSLVVVDTKGCKSDSIKKVVVINPNPNAGFTTLNTCLGDAFTQFNDTSSIADGTQGQFVYSWNFGDATNATVANPNTATTNNPKHVYITTGTYNVALTITSVSGCVASVSKAIKINPLPVVDFDMPAGICLPTADAQFTDRSSIADASEAQFSYAWTFGDPNNVSGASSKNPIHRYTSAGPFNIKLTITSKDGCVKDTTKTLSNIFPQPKAAFTATPDTICLGDNITFTDNSNGMGSAVVKWIWDFKDGKTDTIRSVTHTYASASTYPVTLSIINANGCLSDIATVPVSVNAYPVVDAGPTLFVLQNHSTTLRPIVTGNNLQFVWTPARYLDDDSIKNPLSSPLTDQLYRLTVTGIGGCAASDTVRVKIFKDPLIPNVFSPNGDGINDKWVITYLDTYPGASVEVYNRYGQRVYSSVGKSLQWDGTIDGKELPVGTYYYLINPRNGREQISGSVTILK
jgi:gliding motility-associated-like protein